MTVSNLVGELIQDGLIEETSITDETAIYNGRPPIQLQLAEVSPCVCGMLIKRGFLQVVLADLGGKILESSSYAFDNGLTVTTLLETLVEGYKLLKKKTTRRILAVGISCIGPVNSTTGYLLNPPDFFEIENVPLVEIVEEKTGLPAFLINDANAGALAEKMYGHAKEESNFVYLHIMNGIGAGLVLQDSLYNGNCGQSGEIGHTSINFAGPRCSCGNTGCLDLYANIPAMQRRIRQLAPLHPQSSLSGVLSPTWNEIIDLAHKKDNLAIIALDDFCSYIAFALIDVLNTLDLSTVVVGYNSNSNGRIIEDLLRIKISDSVLYSRYREVDVYHSAFGGDAPLVGSAAIVADKIFNLELKV